MKWVQEIPWLQAIPWIIVVLGWFATHAFSEARERRKDVKAQLEKLNVRFLSVEESAISFHTKAEFDSAQARDIATQLDRTERAIGRIQILSARDLQLYIIALRRSITLENFDSSEFKQQAPSSELLQEITHATFEIEDEIERQYQQHYPATFPYFRWPGIKKFLHFWR